MKVLAWAAVAAGLAIVGCSLSAKYTIGGTLTGLMGQGLVLEDNLGNDLSLDTNGTFAFTDGIKNGGAYSVTVKTQPSDPAQTCTVHNGSGTVDKADVTQVIVACTQAGRFAYVANQLSNNLSAYLIDSANGALIPMAGSPFAATGTTPISLAVDPNGRYLYVVDSGSNDVSVYAIDNSTGVLSSAGVPSATGSSPYAVTVDPRDNYVYVTNFASNSVSAYAIDPTTGLLAEIPNSPFAVGASPTSLKIDPNGNFLYVTSFGSGDVAVLAIDSATGALTAIPGSPFGAGKGALSIAIDPAGAFAYVANETAASVSEFSIDASTGALTAVSGSPLAAGISSASHSTGKSASRRIVRLIQPSLALKVPDGVRPGWGLPPSRWCWIIDTAWIVAPPRSRLDSM